MARVSNLPSGTGDVNAIADTVIHAQIYKYLIDLHEILVRIRANQGVSLDNLSTPPSPSFVPPFTIFAPWCFRALLLPDTYQRGKMYALRLLCLLTVRPQVRPVLYCLCSLSVRKYDSK